MLEVKGEEPRIWARVERLMDHLGMGIFPYINARVNRGFLRGVKCMYCTCISIRVALFFILRRFPCSTTLLLNSGVL
jgi:hypothetical protein